jgi:hypothetical protein
MIYFVTENWLKTNTPITANIDAVKIFPFVQSQADMRIQPLLLHSRYNSSTGSHNPAVQHTRILYLYKRHTYPTQGFQLLEKPFSYS